MIAVAKFEEKNKKNICLKLMIHECNKLKILFEERLNVFISEKF